MAKKWMGSEPKCDFCQRQPKRFFVDGATRQGPWAMMCEGCFVLEGVGLGTGRGQKYDAKTREKVGG